MNNKNNKNKYKIINIFQKMSTVNNKEERTKRALIELENKEKYGVRKLMDEMFQKKKDNECNIL